ncbi:MAG: hypothetical protein QW101_03625 [Ignisphaera sp.]|uniref:Transcription factor S n=1 Tax=Ignisphaera aggregans TaxID=334771 RepID=A0A7J3MZM0_9CREN
MYFCPKCGSTMIVRKNSFFCPKCRYTAELNSTEIQYLKRSTLLSKVHEKKVDVDNIGIPLSAIHDDKIVCPRCHNRGVYYWRRHRASAESSDTIEKVYKCGRCNYSWTEFE